MIITRGTADQVAGTVSGATIHGTSTTSFSPAAGELVRVQVACLNATDHLGDTFTCVDSHGNDFGTPAYNGSPGDGDGGCYLFVWDHVYSSAPGATTITVTKTSSNAQMDFLILPTRYAGAAASQSGGARNRFSEVGTSTTTYQIALTPTVLGSDILVLAAPNHNGGATGPVTAIAGTTTLADWDDGTVGSRGTFGKSSALTTALTSTTYGWTSANPSPNGYGVMALETVPDQSSVVLTRIQHRGMTTTSTTATSLTATLPAGATNGNLLVATITVGTNLTVTPPSGWTQAGPTEQVTSSLNQQIWYKIPSADEAASYTWSWSGTHSFGWTLDEWNSSTGWAASPVDSSAGAVHTTASTAVNCGSPAATVKAVELLYGVLSWASSGQTLSGVTAGWTAGDTAVFTGQNTSAAYYEVSSATLTPSLAATLSVAEFNAGVVATFKPNDPSSGTAVTSTVTADLSSMTPSAAMAESLDSTVTADLSAMTPAATVNVAVPVTSTATADLSAMTPAVTLIASDVNAVTSADLSAMSPAASVGVANPVTSAASASLDSMTPSAALLESFFGQAALPGNGGIAATGVIAYLGAVSMGGTGGITAAPERSETLMVNGQDIMQCSSAFTADLSSVVSVPPKRTANVTVPGKHGAVRVPRKLYAPAVMAMTIWVRGMNADGTFPPGGQRDVVFYQNLDALLQMFSGIVTLEHVTPDATSRVITAEVLDAIDFTRYAWSSESTGKIGVTLSAVDPFWRDLAPVDAAAIAASSSATVQLTEFAPSTGPVEDAVITFTGPCNNPKLASGDWWVQYGASLTAGQSVTVDCGEWTVTGAGGLTADYSKLTHAGIGPWFALEPAPGGPTVTFSVTGGGTGTCAVSARNSFLGG